MHCQRCLAHASFVGCFAYGFVVPGQLYHRITGKRLNVSQALRDPASVPFCESLAYGLGGVAPNVGVEAHLDKLLFNAVEDADVSLAALLIRAGANASVAPVHRFSALHEAAFQGNVSMIDLLVDSGADPTVSMSNRPCASDRPLVITNCRLVGVAR
jgi:hypothetical protein